MRFDPTPLPPPLPPRSSTGPDFQVGRRPPARRPIRVRLFLPLVLVIVALAAIVGKLLEEHAHDQAALDEAKEEVANERHLRRRAEEAAKKAQARVATPATPAAVPAPAAAAPPSPPAAEPPPSAPTEPGAPAPEGRLIPRLHLNNP